MKLQQICLRIWYHSIRHVSFENQRENLLDRYPSIRHANLNCKTLVGKTIAMLSMQDTCLLVPADLFTTQSVCLPIFYHSFQYACWCYVSLFAIPECMVSHYQPCLLVWSLTIGHAFWCDASLSAMPSGMLSHHRPRLLVWSLIINHDHWCGASL